MSDENPGSRSDNVVMADGTNDEARLLTESSGYHTGRLPRFQSTGIISPVGG
jgi:hypothetical protein